MSAQIVIKNGANPQDLQPLPVDVISVQSQVVYGRVGNSVAAPVLHGFGLNVSVVPTVLLSNTPHYPTLHGGALPIDWFRGYLQDLLARGALRQTRAILIGYLGNPEQAAALSHWIGQVLSEYPEVMVIVDPVIGDCDTGVYVAPGMVEAYQRHLLPLAHGLSPNGFELARLTGMPVDSIESAIAAARTLLTARQRWLVITSAAPEVCASDEVQLAVVTGDEARIVKHPRIPAAPKGTGDMFSAVLVALLLKDIPLFDAVEQASAYVVAALEQTHRVRCGELLLPASRL